MFTATLEAPLRFVPPMLMKAAVPHRPDAVSDNNCARCQMRRDCLPGEMTDEQMSRLNGVNFVRRRVTAGRALYRQGDRFNFLYAVRSGTFKGTLMMTDGREQVSGFYMAGEVMGLDGVAQAEHASNATALEDSEVCAIDYASLNDSPEEGQRVQQMISRLMSREIVREHRLMMLLGSMSAEERLASFLLNVSQRLKARGYSATEFNLRMTRAEIGSYLGLTLETVSRTFSQFQKQKLLLVDKRFVRLQNIAALESAFSGTASSRFH